MKQDTGPSVLFLLVAIVSLALWQATPEEPWSPPYVGRDLGWGKLPLKKDALILDTHGLSDLPGLEPDRMMEVAPGRRTLLSLQPDGDSKLEYPRAVLTRGTGDSWIKATLSQPRTGRMLFVGPLTGKVDTPLYRPSDGGISLEGLRLLPPRTTRAVQVDTTGLHLTEELRSRLMAQWKQWEFEPYVTLADTFGSTLVYGEWEDGTILAVEVSSWEKVEEALRKRFPKNVVALVSTWSHATTISGFQEDSGPAWMGRGNYLMATPDGGVRNLEQFLTRRYDESISFRPRSPLVEEISRLADTQKGWHVCIIEQPIDGAPHWGALLRWPRPDDPTIEGFLVVWVPPKSRKEKNS